MGIENRDLLGSSGTYVVEAHEKGGSKAARDIDELVSEVTGVAMVAPSILSQYDAPIEQVYGAIKAIGFKDVIEVARGAEITTEKETHEFAEKMEEGQPFMTTSCCPSYMEMARKHAPELQKYISSTYSPMIYTAELAREKHPNAKLVFVGPCIAKRKEVRREDLQGKVDFVLTYEEVHAMLGGMGIELGEANIHPVDCASRRSAHGFAENGGVTAAVKELVAGKLDFTTLQIAGLNKKNVGVVGSTMILVMDIDKTAIAADAE